MNKNLLAYRDFIEGKSFFQKNIYFTAGMKRNGNFYGKKRVTFMRKKHETF